MSEPMSTVGDLLDACAGLPRSAPICMRGFSVYERMKLAGRSAPLASADRHRCLKRGQPQWQPALVLEYEPPEHHEGD